MILDKKESRIREAIHYDILKTVIAVFEQDCDEDQPEKSRLLDALDEIEAELLVDD